MEEWLFIVEFGMGIPGRCSKKCHLRIFFIIIYLNNIYSLQLFQEQATSSQGPSAWEAPDERPVIRRATRRALGTRLSKKLS